MRIIFSLVCLFASLPLLAVELPSDAEIQRKAAEQRGSVADLMGKVGGQVGTGAVITPPAHSLKTNPRAIEELMGNLKASKEPLPNKTGDDLIVFVSLSMPVDVIQEMSRQAKASGAKLLMRGLKDNSFRETLKALKEINKNIGVEWEINPSLFKTFKVETVPSIVLADASKVVPSEEGCAPDAAFESVSGAISIEQALTIIKSKGQPGIARLAEVRLNKLHGR